MQFRSFGLSSLTSRTLGAGYETTQYFEGGCGDANVGLKSAGAMVSTTNAEHEHASSLQKKRKEDRVLLRYVGTVMFFVSSHQLPLVGAFSTDCGDAEPRLMSILVLCDPIITPSSRHSHKSIFRHFPRQQAIKAQDLYTLSNGLQMFARQQSCLQAGSTDIVSKYWHSVRILLVSRYQ